MRSQNGFTLLEVLIAFAIAALALTALAETAGAGLGSTVVAGQTEEALSRARSHLVAAALHPLPGETTGDDGGGFAWRVAVRPVAVAEKSPAALYEITAEISWPGRGANRTVRLSTLRLGRIANAP